MTATEELRRMLDEREIEHYDYDPDPRYSGPTSDRKTEWDGASFREWPNGTIRFGAKGTTPAQAIAATVGEGTCHYIPDDTGFVWWDENDEEHYEGGSASDECGSASCDKCGYEMMVGDDGWFNGWDEITEWWEEDGSYHKGYVLTPRFKFCPNCGRRIEVGE